MGIEPPAQKAPRQSPDGHEDGMVALSYVLAGLMLYGFLGWAGDAYFETSWLLPVGLIVGLVASIYLIYKRYGSVK
ncbi:AtpZ/AtpI family protein [Tessaracoccus sp. OH4464_COT-324]|uniref:AtpZ/AtpI family protein n=1 Tax=Tessaracoccus sp. OH4464_COT-324 TaxID=2491059 RepID=UPI000F63F56C|nr:AtpZ/AtpI family protein [Tessaracoccus sp. OH4464_COT-324]RRD47884.1 hypothetical protein EII42_01155 [Tessaracoccus sp. OH4464_COT-324]